MKPGTLPGIAHSGRMAAGKNCGIEPPPRFAAAKDFDALHKVNSIGADPEGGSKTIYSGSFCIFSTGSG
jgi:hypothetical protein